MQALVRVKLLRRAEQTAGAGKGYLRLEYGPADSIPILAIDLRSDVYIDVRAQL